MHPRAGAACSQREGLGWENQAPVPGPEHAHTHSPSEESCVRTVREEDDEKTRRWPQ